MRFNILVIDPADNVGVALTDLKAGDQGLLRSHDRLVPIGIREAIPFGHKVAVRDLAAGENVVKYGQVMGRTTAPIAVGQHVHVHNIEGLRGRGDISTGKREER